MRFYKLNGVWQSWDYLHNELGYAEHETRPTVFKSCADATWGEDAGNGYYDGDVSDMINGTFWTDADPTGWFNLDGLVWNSETYPADATPSLLVKDGVASDALVITCDDGNYYLIRAIIDTTAWIPESEVEALGWRSPSFVVVDSTTGKVVSGFNQELTTYELPSVILSSEDGYETYELPSVSLPTPNVVIGVPITGPVQAFWFTDNGRDETNDKMFTVVGNPLFNEDGSVARNELYDSAVPLSFMRYDGNMFEADSDSDIVRYLPVTDRLVLSIPGDSTTRDKSAWSVQVAKLFVLSYANTQLPDVQIELPINEVGTYGTSITLPTIDGEYESGGKTWKPSAWDIGAFGSSYSLTADTVAHLVFEEVQQYQEITLYMQSGRKEAQSEISSGFSGNVDPTYTYPLYYDSGLTDPFVYDYSKDYEVGYYSSSTGEWVRYTVQSVSDMPSSSAATGRILLDTGALWLITNSASAGITSTSITIRIYPKEQQVFALYFNASSVYNNVSMAYNTAYDMNGSPNTGSSPIPLTSNFPGKDIVGVYGSAGNLVSSGYKNFSWVGSTKLRVGYYNTDAGTLSARLLLFTTDQYIDIAYINTSGDTSVSSGSAKTLYSKDGFYLLYIPSLFTYTPLALFKHNGSCADNSSGNYIKSTTLGNYTGPSDALCLKQTYRTISFSYIWYLRTPISQ